jgi:anti-anti-sigma regulatory factor
MCDVSDLPVQSGRDSVRIQWTGECCIDSLSERREELLRALEDGVPVVLDTSGVSRIDTAGLQLLLSFVLTMQRDRRPVTCAAASAAVIEGARLAGLGELLGLANG